ncbi:hypothetical protein D3X12_28920 [Pseudomonas protegens]|jgi:hypothetical protein|uniref:Uncharacterized protein n=2 Tax=Pseudomonas protegens TaxID=380021 RepID=Q4K7L5_PSEF5|nr:hypothetical protein [Pseudomonas protegens]AAY93926.1 conserved hypothetical protein [Pseudomonas protegens Pf-5]ASE21912.1 hypothetical protein CEP86_16045 [Pseudomonas protegens]QEZ54404.1 hypothetical protein D3X12_28920 [Pseudomonas protegens]QEZ59393.1 hypothetical protein D4N38_22900 [Pseudomonas protegens]QEZ65690.1 hypothetical protein D4N37_24245 [Pseudomonas protegens]
MSIPSASTDAYLTLPVVLDNAAWMRVVYLENPARVAEMSQRLATVVQTAWQELKQHPLAKPFTFGVYVKRHTGRQRDWVALALRVVTLENEPSYIQIHLQPAADLA